MVSILTSDQIIWAHKMWNLGYPYKDIGEALNVSGKIVARALRKTYGKADKKRIRPKLVYRGLLQR